MSVASDIHAKFFPRSRPIVRAVIPPKPAPPHLVPLSEEDVLISEYRAWSAAREEAHRLAVLAIYDEGYQFGLTRPVGRSERDANKIIELVCQRFDVTFAELVGRGRAKMIVNARRAASLAMRKELGMSYPSIAKKLHRDHSSIVGLLRPKTQRAATVIHT